MEVSDNGKKAVKKYQTTKQKAKRKASFRETLEDQAVGGLPDDESKADTARDARKATGIKPVHDGSKP